MDRHRWRRVEAIFMAALEEQPAEWPEFLASRCRGDEELAEEAASLLAAHALVVDETGTPDRPTTLDELEAEGQVELGGRRFGPYRVVRLLGRGGMSTVFLAARADAEYRRLVALKLLRSPLGTAELKVRFLRERQILADLDHPNIARMYEGGTTPAGVPFVVMEWVDGLPIDLYCERWKLPVAERVRLCRVLCDAVSYAHRNLVVHRDLKPSNVLVTGEGVPKLLDFGIAKLLSPEHAGDTATEAGPPLTPSHASPEQLRGEPVTTASDVYSLGVLLYELVCGHLPHAETLAGRFEQLVAGYEPPPPSGARTATDLDAVVLKAVATAPEERYSSVDELAEDLRRWEHGLPVTARRQTWVYRARKFARRHTIGTALGATAVLVLVGLVWVLAVLTVRVTAERDLALAEREKAEQVTEALVGIFEAADPREGDGEAVTVHEVLDLGARIAGDGLREQPAVQASVLDAVARVYQGLGLFDRAQPLFERAASLRARQLGPGHPDTLASRMRLALLLRDRGELAGSREMLEAVVAAHRGRSEERDLRRAEAEVGLAFVLTEAGELERAEDLLRQAIEAASGPSREALRMRFDALHVLAVVDQERGDLEAARRAYGEALAIGARALGPRNPNLLTVRKSFAELQRATGDLDGAARTFREVLEAERVVFGPDHPRLGYTLNGLALALLDLGRLDEAERMAREGLELRERLFGPESTAAGVSLSALAAVLSASGRTGEAVPLYERSLVIVDSRFAPGSPAVSHPLLGLGTALLAEGRPRDAEPHLRRAAEVRHGALSPGHPLVTRADVALARCLLAEARDAEAAALLQEALEPIAGSGSPEEAEVLELLARADPGGA